MRRGGSARRSTLIDRDSDAGDVVLAAALYREVLAAAARRVSVRVAIVRPAGRYIYAHVLVRRGQVDHTRLPRRRQSSLLYGVVINRVPLPLPFRVLDANCQSHCRRRSASTRSTSRWDIGVGSSG